MDYWPIFVLTLPGDDARRAPLLSQLEGAGFSPQLFFGVDGRNGLPSDCEALINRDGARQALGRDMTDGEFACALSHRAIYAKILDDGLPGAVIFEDDARLAPELLDLMTMRQHQQVPMILFHYRYGRGLAFSRKRLSPTGSMQRAVNRATSTMAYALRCDSAAVLMSHATPVSFQADWPCDLYAAKAWLLNPRMAFEAEGNVSHLQDDRARTVRNVPKPPRGHTFGQWVRARVSTRVGRERGQP